MFYIYMYFYINIYIYIYNLYTYIYTFGIYFLTSFRYFENRKVNKLKLIIKILLINNIICNVSNNFKIYQNMKSYRIF